MNYFKDLQPFLFLEELEQEIGIPAGFFDKLIDDDDWTFVIKLHSLIEAAMTHYITEKLGEPQLRDFISRIDLSHSTMGRLAIAKAISALEKDHRRFIKLLSEMRNSFVHDVQNVSTTIIEFLDEMPKSRRKGFDKAFKWGYENVDDISVHVEGFSDDYFSLPETTKFFAVTIYEYLPRLSIWLGATLVLRHIYTEIRIKEIKDMNDETMLMFANALLDKYQQTEDDGESSQTEIGT
jgi:hypothetical protein